MNQRGPMVPHEVRARMDRARLFRTCATTLEQLAIVIANSTYTQSEVENTVIEVEKAIKDAQIEIKRMKDESQS